MVREPFLDCPAKMEASTASDSGGPSAPLAAIPSNLPVREPATSPAHPSAKPDPPLAPSADDLHGPCGMRGSSNDSEMAMEVESRIEESVIALGDLGVRDGTRMEVGNHHVPTPDPDVVAAQWSYDTASMYRWR